MSAHPLRAPRQVFAFARKELAEILRQPRLLLVMVLGPFAVMAAFGLAYEDEPPALRTTFVMDPDSPFRDQLDSYAGQVGEFVDVRGVVDDRATADRMLARGDIDVIVEFPVDPIADVMGGEQAMVTVIHTRLDPIERTAINFVSSLAIDQINSEVLAQVVTAGQDVGEDGVGLLAAAQTHVTLLRAAIAANDADAAGDAAAELRDDTTGLATIASLADAVDVELGDGGGAADLPERLRSSMRSIDDLLADTGSWDAAALDRELAGLEQLLTDGSEQYAAALAADPRVLVRPLDRQVQLAVDRITSVADWYAPAAVMLMLQQFGVAFGAMAFVRERQLGIEDVYRIAPVGAAGSLLGKYLTYLIVGSAIGATLTALVVGALGVPLGGSLGDMAVAMLLTLFASIGLGFVLSLFSRSDAQAVQYTMIVLLASLFFSGFFLPVTQMTGVAGWVPYLLPVTAGMDLLRDVMLRNRGLAPEPVTTLAIYGAVMFVISFAVVRRRISPRIRRVRTATA